MLLNQPETRCGGPSAFEIRLFRWHKEASNNSFFERELDGVPIGVIVKPGTLRDRHSSRRYSYNDINKQTYKITQKKNFKKLILQKTK